MTLPLGRLAIAYSPHRLPAHSRRASISSTQSRSRPTQRGGRNLGLRYQQLESSIRNTVRKVALLEEMTDTSRLAKQRNSVTAHNESRVPRGEVETFRGLVVPQEPEPPESDECCMSGCAVCVYDLYEDSLLTYKASITLLGTQLKSMGIQKSEWPSRIKSSPDSRAVQRPSDTSLDAFEAMEKTLKAKQQGRVDGDESLPKTHPNRFQLIVMLYEGMKRVVFSNR
ncbi:hypothetical protein BDM02DRAFT_2959503 [Thelephora ganbajun]|uniref:Uncharacterized protein n=1 Tax=Thelephora ganbajun TaxID=370292 RepID=A0ACB6ZST8_THEGA|nr:hypothetical protein BDM02DRAFT_2959503 [Thelephora ganbajun]